MKVTIPRVSGRNDTLQPIYRAVTTKRFKDGKMAQVQVQVCLPGQSTWQILKTLAPEAAQAFMNKHARQWDA